MQALLKLVTTIIMQGLLLFLRASPPFPYRAAVGACAA
jgi:hypothetical protein